MNEFAQNAERVSLKSKLFSLPTLSYLFCVSFGLAMIVNVQSLADGNWYWYARLLREGIKPYQQLGLTLQPLLPLETMIFQDILGESWIASHVAAIFHLIIFSSAIFYIASISNLSNRIKSVIILFSFFFGIRFEAYRFDDYHVVSDSISLWIAAITLKMPFFSKQPARITAAASLGVFAALSLMTRLNDGIFVGFFCVIAIIVINRESRLASLTFFSAFFFLVTYVLIACTGDSVYSWVMSSVIHASSIKGGGAKLALDPFLLLIAAASSTISTSLFPLIELIALSFSWVCIVKKCTTINKSSFLTLSPCIAIFTISTLELCIQHSQAQPELAVLAISCLIVAGFGAYSLIASGFSLRTRPTNCVIDRRIVPLLPALMLLSGSLSSAGSFIDLYTPVSVLVLVVCATYPVEKFHLPRSVIATIFTVVTFSIIWYRIDTPWKWIDYRSARMFTGREVTNNHTYGPMYIETKHKNFIDQVCTIVHNGDPKPELLTLPWPYGNYYCAIAPWHNVVQTWFDTTPSQVIDQLEDQLSSNPPKWIFYQRQLSVLKIHEDIFNNGKPLAQRGLDTMIINQITNGQWRVMLDYSPGGASEWMLIHTRLNVAPGKNILQNSNGLHALEHWREWNSAARWIAIHKKRNDFLVENESASSSHSFLSHKIEFLNTGPVTVAAAIKSIDLSKSATRTFSVSLIDMATGNLMGGTGPRNLASPELQYYFNALVTKHSQYLLVLMYDGQNNATTFSDIRTRTAFTSQFADIDKPPKWTNISAPLNTWNVSATPAVWSSNSKDGGTFTVNHTSNSLIESILSQDLKLDQSGPITIKAHITVDNIQPNGGYGCSLDLFDRDSNKVVVSMRNPIAAGSSDDITLGALIAVNKHYQLRLRFNAGTAQAHFSHLRVEDGASNNF